MPKRSPKLDIVDEAIKVLAELVDEFDPEDREEMKARADVLTSLLFESRLFGASADDDLLELDDALRAMGGKSSQFVSHAKRFYRWLSTYDDQARRTADSAREDLAIFGGALLEDLNEAKGVWTKES